MDQISPITDCGAYVRLTSGGASVIQPGADKSELLFIDLDIELKTEEATAATVQAVLEHLLVVPELLDNCRTLVVRWPFDQLAGDLATQVRTRLAALSARLGGLQPRIYLLRQAFGMPPTLSYAQRHRVTPLEEAVILAECRATESAALLAEGQAVSRPKFHHYRLPSGAHAGAFVRVADAIQSPRDALVLSSWILNELADCQLVVLESATLVPISLAIQALCTQAAASPPPIRVLPNYYISSLEIRGIIGSASNVLFIQSASSTGYLTERIAMALDRAQANGSINVLVDRPSSSRGMFLGSKEKDGIARWLSVAALAEVYPNGLLCQICQSAERSRYLQIDAKSFEALVLPRPSLVTPSMRGARHNRSLWEFCSQTHAMGVSCAPDAGARPDRPELLDFKYHITDLVAGISHEDFYSAMYARLDGGRRRIFDSGIDRTDLVVTRKPAEKEWTPVIGSEGRLLNAEQYTTETLRSIFAILQELAPDRQTRSLPEIVFVPRGDDVQVRTYLRRSVRRRTSQYLSGPPSPDIHCVV